LGVKRYCAGGEIGKIWCIETFGSPWPPKSISLRQIDSGILNALLGIRTHDDLLAHPVVGASFEGYAMENLLASAGGYETSFYRTGAGAEIDLVLRRGRRVLAFELKSATVPRVTKGFWNALEDIVPDEAFVVAPVKERYPLKNGMMVTPLHDIVTRFVDSEY